MEIESGLYKTCARSLLKVSAEAQGEVIADSSPQDNANTTRQRGERITNMADFKVAHKITADCEGGYVNDPKDAGGETIFGIARNMWKDLPLWKIVDDYKKMVGDLSQKSERKQLEKLCLGNAEFVEQKNAFYKAQFWDKVKGDEIKSQAVANNVYDFAVNAGIKQAVKTLQRALGIADDGAFGNGTLSACNSADSKKLNNDYCVGRENFYKDLVKRKPNNEKFLAGWLGRVKRFYV